MIKLPLACWAMHTSGLALIYTLHILSYVGFVAGLAILNYRECGHDSVNCVKDPQGILGSQNDLKQPNFHWWGQTLAYPIRGN